MIGTLGDADLARLSIPPNVRAQERNLGEAASVI